MSSRKVLTHLDYIIFDSVAERLNLKSDHQNTLKHVKVPVYLQTKWDILRPPDLRHTRRGRQPLANVQ